MTSINRREFLGQSTSCAAYLALAASAMPLSARQLWASTTTGALVRREPWGNLEKVADGVWAMISTPLGGDSTTVSNGGIIAGKNGVLAIEGFNKPAGAQWLAGQCRELTGRWPTHVALTHFHSDHANGLSGYVSDSDHPTVHATTRTRELVVEKNKPTPITLTTINGAVGIDPTKPSTIDLGGKVVRVVPRNGHTESDVSLELDDPSIVAAIAVWQLRGPSQALGESDLILIADFENTTGDDVFDGTLKQALAVKLEESPFLNVLSDQRVAEQLRFMNRAPDTPLTPAIARDLCQRQGIKAVMLGGLASLGSTYIVTLTAENCATGDVLAREQVTATNKEQVLGALGGAATTIRGRLGESLASIQRTDKPIEQATTTSLEALKAFSVGDQRRNTGTDQEAIPFFRRAIELDQDFAMAHAQLGTVYANLGEQELAKKHRSRAFELRDRVSERERLYISAHYYNGVEGNVAKALEVYDLWKQTYPRDAVPYINSGTLFTGRNQHEEALQAYLKALELDPTRRLGYANALGKLLQLDRIDEAEELVKRQIEVMGESPETNLRLYEIAARRKDRAAMDQYARLLENSSVELNFLGLRASELAYYGRAREAQRVAQRNVELLQRQGLTSSVPALYGNMAAIMSFLGDKKAAIAYADKAATEAKDNVDLHANLAYAYAATAEVRKARYHAEAVLRAPIPDQQLKDLIEKTFEGLIALTTGRPRDALRWLETLPDVNLGVRANALLTRAEAHRALKQYAEAERDYRAVLTGPSIGPYVFAVPMSRAGLARTLVAAGKIDEAREEYKKLLDEWKDADPDLEKVKELRAEFARLQT